MTQFKILYYSLSSFSLNFKQNLLLVFVDDTSTLGSGIFSGLIAETPIGSSIIWIWLPMTLTFSLKLDPYEELVTWLALEYLFDQLRLTPDDDEVCGVSALRILYNFKHHYSLSNHYMNKIVTFSLYFHTRYFTTPFVGLFIKQTHSMNEFRIW